MSYKLIVFDLDDTLLDTTRLLLPIARTPAFHERIRQPLPLMEGARENLDFLATRYQLALVTQGHVESQKQKIRSLGVESYFTNFYFADPSTGESKKEKFEQVVKDFALAPGELLSVGNRRSSDLRWAKKVGGITCLFRYGEHQDEPIEMPEDLPDYEVLHHRELVLTCRL